MKQVDVPFVEQHFRGAIGEGAVCRLSGAGDIACGANDMGKSNVTYLGLVMCL